MDITIDPMQQYQPLLDDSVNSLPRRCAGFDGIGTSLDRLRYSLQDLEDAR